MALAHARNVGDALLSWDGHELSNTYPFGALNAGMV